MYKYKAKLLIKAIRIFAFLQTKSFGDLALLFSWNIMPLTIFKHFSLIDAFTWSNWKQYIFELIICIIIFVWYWYLYSSAEDVIPGYSPLIAKHDHQYLQSQIWHLYYICGDFNILHKEWLVHSNTTDDWRQVLQRLLHHLWTNTDHWRTHPCIGTSGKPNWPLPHILPWKMLHSSFTPSSDLSLISVKVNTKQKISPELSFHRIIFWYTKAD